MSLREEATVTSKGQVTIPKPIRDRFQIDEGTQVEFVVGPDGDLTVRTRADPTDRLRAVKETLADHDVDLEGLRRESKRAWGGGDLQVPAEQRDSDRRVDEQ